MEGHEQQFKDASAISTYFLTQGYPCWLDCGSLLGFIRDGSPIPHDNDIDISCFTHDVQTTIELIGEFHNLDHDYTFCAETVQKWRTFDSCLNYNFLNDVGDVGRTESKNNTTYKIYGNNNKDKKYPVITNCGSYYDPLVVSATVHIDHDLKLYTISGGLLNGPWCNGFCIDIYISNSYRYNRVDYAYTWASPTILHKISDILPLRQFQSFAWTYWVPNNVDKILLNTYGPDWEIPANIQNEEIFRMRYDYIKSNATLKNLFIDILFSDDTYREYVKISRPYISELF